MSENLYGRRRSVDVGGLALALNDGQSGHGWGGWEDADDGGTRYGMCHLKCRVLDRLNYARTDMPKS